jgi:hypothetical protein
MTFLSLQISRASPIWANSVTVWAPYTPADEQMFQRYGTWYGYLTQYGTLYTWSGYLTQYGTWYLRRYKQL